MGAFLLVSVALLAAGVVRGDRTALYVALTAMTTGELARTAWLALRSRRGRTTLRLRDG